MRTRVKVCCIQDLREAQVAIRLGADALGLVSAMPSGPGPIPEERIAEIVRGVPPPVSCFLLTAQKDAAAIAAQHERTGADTLQLVDRLAPAERAALRRLRPGARIVQVVHVTGPASVDEALEAATHAHALLLDSGRPDAAVRELGGTGRTHDWSVSRRIREQTHLPVFLAGGLRPDNVGQALDEVGPFGLDLCSGVRTAGHLDPSKLEAFLRAVAA